MRQLRYAIAMPMPAIANSSEGGAGVAGGAGGVTATIEKTMFGYNWATPVPVPVSVTKTSMLVGAVNVTDVGLAGSAGMG